MHLSWVNGLAFQNGIFCIVAKACPPRSTDQGTVAVGLIVEGSYKWMVCWPVVAELLELRWRADRMSVLA